jgi:hypothetical protein
MITFIVLWIYASICGVLSLMYIAFHTPEQPDSRFYYDEVDGKFKMREEK